MLNTASTPSALGVAPSLNEIQRESRLSSVPAVYPAVYLRNGAENKTDPFFLFALKSCKLSASPIINP
jgi:hypothetical protein